MYAREARNRGYVTSNKDFISDKHKKFIRKTKEKVGNPFELAFDWAKDGMKKSYLKNALKDMSITTQEAHQKDIYDVLEIYNTLFRNLELVVQEELNRNNINHREAIDILVSFSISGECTNILLERVLEIILPRLKESKYTRYDLELIINYFPQTFWMNSRLHNDKQDYFNNTIASIVLKEVDDFSNHELLSFFQAYSQAEKFPPELLNKMLNTIASKIENNMFTKDQFMNFLEIYAIMMNNDSGANKVDSELLLSIISNFISKNHKDPNYEFTFDDIAELFWIYGWLDAFNSSNLKLTKPLYTILDLKLAEFLEKHKPLTALDYYEGEKQDVEFNVKNAETIKYYLEKDKASHKQTISVRFCFC